MNTTVLKSIRGTTLALLVLVGGILIFGPPDTVSRVSRANSKANLSDSLYLKCVTHFPRVGRSKHFDVLFLNDFGVALRI